MSNRTWSLVGAAAACCAAAVFALPSASAAPTTDSGGYVDSTARCAQPNEATVFGSTATSRVAICKTPSGSYEYRGVRLRDGAKLIRMATKSGDTYSVYNDGITYTVSSKSLKLTEGSRVIRDETWVDFHGASSSSSSSSSPSGPGMSPPPAESTPTTSAKPLPPPLPAEVGHTDS
ncbi:hypothetical protein [Mycolicibacterium celeriflavum]|uniref:hypothetical protein n=1 Tax=Mycolicibacterium celeriflavum TaxID=1249101 RepID=UPI003CEF6FF6